MVVRDEAREPAPSDWTPEQQIAHMLELCEAQMESALAESDEAVTALIRSFTGLAEATRELRSSIAALPPHLREPVESRLNDSLAAIQDDMTSAVVAFQFYDKLTQRLGHVRYSLTSLAMFVCNREQANAREQWQRLFTALRRLYRTQEEREIFELMRQGVAAPEVPAAAGQDHDAAAAARAGEVELF